MLYVFSGASRDTSFRAVLERLASAERVTLHIDEVDIRHGSQHDLTQPPVQEQWLEKVRRGRYQAILCTPPCSTFSRVRMANMRGPPPIRSRQHPRGYPWLSNAHRSQADLGNALVDFTWRVYQAVEALAPSSPAAQVILFTEHPEDLGRVYREEDGRAMDPASIWQQTEVHRLLASQHLGLFTLALNQCCLGAKHRKPTRILTNLAGLKHWGPQGLPTFDSDYRFLGPLQECGCPTRPLAKRSNSEGFRTTGTEQYPPDMDRQLAEAVGEALRRIPSPPPGGGGSEM